MQTWLEEIKWQQTIDEEKEIAYDERGMRTARSKLQSKTRRICSK